MTRPDPTRKALSNRLRCLVVDCHRGPGMTRPRKTTNLMTNDDIDYDRLRDNHLFGDGMASIATNDDMIACGPRQYPRSLAMGWH